jgi:hypothetical protein
MRRPKLKMTGRLDFWNPSDFINVTIKSNRTMKNDTSHDLDWPQDLTDYCRVPAPDCIEYEAEGRGLLPVQ